MNKVIIFFLDKKELFCERLELVRIGSRAVAVTIHLQLCHLGLKRRYRRMGFAQLILKLSVKNNVIVLSSSQARHRNHHLIFMKLSLGIGYVR